MTTTPSTVCLLYRKLDLAAPQMTDLIGVYADNGSARIAAACHAEQYRPALRLDQFFILEKPILHHTGS